jgi:hypothetical protein
MASRIALTKPLSTSIYHTQYVGNLGVICLLSLMSISDSSVYNLPRCSQEANILYKKTVITGKTHASLVSLLNSLLATYHLPCWGLSISDISKKASIRVHEMKYD